MLLKKCNHSLCNQIKNHALNDETLILVLKENKLAVTKPRVMILKILMNSQMPLTVEDIIEKMGKNSCDTATVYRVLGQFTENDIATANNLEKDLVHYEYNNPLHHHHHIICNNCKKIEKIEGCHLDQVELGLSKIGYTNIGHKLQFFGTCKNCAA